MPRSRSSSVADSSSELHAASIPCRASLTPMNTAVAASATTATVSLDPHHGVGEPLKGGQRGLGLGGGTCTRAVTRAGATPPRDGHGALCPRGLTRDDPRHAAGLAAPNLGPRARPRDRTGRWRPPLGAVTTGQQTGHGRVSRTGLQTLDGLRGQAASVRVARPTACPTPGAEARCGGGLLGVRPRPGGAGLALSPACVPTSPPTASPRRWRRWRHVTGRAGVLPRGPREGAAPYPVTSRPWVRMRLPRTGHQARSQRGRRCGQGRPGRHGCPERQSAAGRRAGAARPRPPDGRPPGVGV
jgi:hypothetical protein